jgi:hypothetical protein
MMTTFDLAEVRRFTDELEARRERCDHVEGVECANLDGTLASYAKLCCDYCEQVRQWGRAVFYGRAAFDPQVEALWLEAGRDLHRRASELWVYGQEMEGVCFMLEGGAPLGATLWQLERLLTPWVTPRRAVAPLARHGIPADAANMAEAQRRADALPPLPVDWQPSDPGQRKIFQKLRGRRRP